MRKYYLTLIVIAVFAFGFAASDDSSSPSSSSTTNYEQKEEQPKVNMSLVGTYEAIDDRNIPVHFVLKKDGTAESFNPRNRDMFTYYARWEEVRGGIQICYNDANKQPKVEYPYGYSHDHRFDFTGRCCFISGGYLYPDFTTFDKREEGWRIRIVKTK